MSEPRQKPGRSKQDYETPAELSIFGGPHTPGFDVWRWA